MQHYIWNIAQIDQKNKHHYTEVQANEIKTDWNNFASPAKVQYDSPDPACGTKGRVSWEPAGRQRTGNQSEILNPLLAARNLLSFQTHLTQNRTKPCRLKTNTTNYFVHPEAQTKEFSNEVQKELQIRYSIRKRYLCKLESDTDF